MVYRGVGLVLALWAGAAAAQAPDVLVSLSADGGLDGLPVRDQELVFHESGGAAWVQWPSETLALLSGEISGSLHAVFGDVDAVHHAGEGGVAGEGLSLSLLSNELGFQDGDVLSWAPGGWQVAVAEFEFVAATGADDENVDIDAIHIEPDGSRLFSFAENEVSSFLSGDEPNLIKDGDVLCWPFGDPVAHVYYTEAEIDALVSNALGAATSTGDTTGLWRSEFDGEMWFTVQSPSSHDASVFSDKLGGMSVAGHAESDFAFDGAAEIDALTLAPARFPGVVVSNGKPASDELLTIELRGAEPGKPHIVLGALAMVAPQVPLSGWGGLVLDDDVLLSASLQGAPQLAMFPDGLGRASFAYQMPPAIMPVDVVMQVLWPGPGPGTTNPLVLELEQ